ncbi:hypothetical protein WG70_28665 [Burkholderia oklahomensis EO147]|nr:hypothetical protein WG70_28665 [Burkholderia oklahomensis EO147]KUY54031.1 hypothetical protein WG70_12940 [Burkholderia oklahomensis EO147]
MSKRDVEARRSRGGGLDCDCAAASRNCGIAELRNRGIAESRNRGIAPRCGRNLTEVDSTTPGARAGFRTKPT